MIYTTKYPQTLQAAKTQNIPVTKVFAKVVPTGTHEYHASYPITDPVAGKIPVGANGEVIPSASKIAAAKSLSQLHGENAAVKANIQHASVKLAKAGVTGTEYHGDNYGHEHVAAKAGHFGAF